jgi:NIPSNAP
VVYLVDTVRVPSEVAEPYVELVGTSAVPVMTDAGAQLVACWATSKDIGEEVEVKIIWSCNDHAEWNTIRKNLVLDPRYYAYASQAAALRKGGTRRFYYPASFSPIP